MALKGYHSYRGRQGIWQRLFVALLVLILIAACAFLFLQRYITYSDDGSFYLDLPFELDWEIPFLNGESKEPEKTPEPEQDMNLIVDRPSEEEKDGQEDQTTEEEPPENDPAQEEKNEPYLPLRLIELGDLPQDEAALIDTLTAAGADGFVFRVKKDLGKVSYASTVVLADAIEDTAVSYELLARLCAQEDVYTVASINCFHDSIYAFANMASAGICQSNGYIWYESDAGGHWLDAEKEAARNYIINFALECAQLGFDELLLDGVQYPIKGKLHKIDYSKNTMGKTEALVLFLTELEKALEPYGVRVSLRLDEEIVRGLADNTADSGFDVHAILPLVDAVYVATDDAEALHQEMGLLLAGESVPVLIPMVNEVTTQSSWCLIG